MEYNKEHTICITNCDSHLGQAIARYCLKKTSDEGHRLRIRVTSRNAKACEKLKELGAEVYEVHFDKENTLKKAFKGCHGVCFIPENAKSRIHDGEASLKAMRDEKVQEVLMLSVIGADTNNKDLKQLVEMRRMEEKTEEIIKDGHWHIFRNGFPYQALLLWTCMIKKESTLRLPINDGKFSSISTLDIGRATYDLLVGKVERQLDNSNSQTKKRYTLTGSPALNGQELVDILNSTLGVNVGFQVSDRDSTRRYLESLKNDPAYSRRYEENENIAWKNLRAKNSGFDDSIFGLEEPNSLNEVCINLVLDYFDYVKEGHANFVSDDIKKLTNKDPEPLQEFVRSHREDLTPDQNL